MEEQEVYGKLFNVIPLVDETHIEAMLSTMDKSTALFNTRGKLCLS